MIFCFEGPFLNARKRQKRFINKIYGGFRTVWLLIIFSLPTFEEILQLRIKFVKASRYVREIR